MKDRNCNNVIGGGFARFARGGTKFNIAEAQAKFRQWAQVQFDKQMTYGLGA